MVDKLNSFKLWLSAAFGAVLSLLGWKLVLVLLLFVLAVIDFVSGWAAAVKNGEWRSSKARDGVAHKVSMFVVVVVSGILDLFLAVICAEIPGLTFNYTGFLLPLVASWYIFTEFGSILENSVLLGAAVPSWLLKVLDVGKKFIDGAGEEITKNSEESQK